MHQYALILFKCYIVFKDNDVAELMIDENVADNDVD